jgi:hypothetical protein
MAEVSGPSFKEDKSQPENPGLSRSIVGCSVIATQSVQYI